MPLTLINLYQRSWGNDTAHDAKGLITWEKKAVDDSYHFEVVPDQKPRDPFHARPEIIVPATVKAYFDRRQYFCSRFDRAHPIIRL